MPQTDPSSEPAPRTRHTRTALRVVLALFYLFAGYAHIADPQTFLKITPGWVPMPETVIFWTGIAELAGAVALAQPFNLKLRQAAGIGLALYALCVWPANINHMMMDMAAPDHGWGLAYHLPRIALQPVLIWLALWTGGVIDWPRRKR
ncbi:DoxX family protein [Croceicoccus pelagius]|uniref:DoxX family protein n=1 Tax=Croceicoccus pelagius TaxID=1703341 RepID=UPI0008346AE5|nr:DoxX family protein [Croceicoccus pelagius]